MSTKSYGVPTQLPFSAFDQWRTPLRCIESKNATVLSSPTANAAHFRAHTRTMISSAWTSHRAADLSCRRATQRRSSCGTHVETFWIVSIRISSTTMQRKFHHVAGSLLRQVLRPISKYGKSSSTRNRRSTTRRLWKLSTWPDTIRACGISLSVSMLRIWCRCAKMAHFVSSISGVSVMTEAEKIYCGILLSSGNLFPVWWSHTKSNIYQFIHPHFEFFVFLYLSFIQQLITQEVNARNVFSPASSRRKRCHRLSHFRIQHTSSRSRSHRRFISTLAPQEPWTWQS